GPRARRLRPGHPPANGARGLLAPAFHGDGQPSRRRARARRQAGRLRRPRAPPARTPADRGLTAVFVTGNGTEVGKTVVAAVVARTLAAEGKRVAVFQPAVTGLDQPPADGPPPDHELLRIAAGSRQGDEEIAPY